MRPARPQHVELNCKILFKHASCCLSLDPYLSAVFWYICFASETLLLLKCNNNKTLWVIISTLYLKKASNSPELVSPEMMFTFSVVAAFPRVSLCANSKKQWMGKASINTVKKATFGFGKCDRPAQVYLLKAVSSTFCHLHRCCRERNAAFSTSISSLQRRMNRH